MNNAVWARVVWARVSGSKTDVAHAFRRTGRVYTQVCKQHAQTLVDISTAEKCKNCLKKLPKNIEVNTAVHEVLAKMLSYRDVLRLNNCKDLDRVLTVAWATADGHSGSLLPHNYVAVEEGMIFVVSDTGKA